MSQGWSCCPMRRRRSERDAESIAIDSLLYHLAGMGV
jgi:hypothetical protein